MRGREGVLSIRARHASRTAGLVRSEPTAVRMEYESKHACAGGSRVARAVGAVCCGTRIGGRVLPARRRVSAFLLSVAKDARECFGAARAGRQREPRFLPVEIPVSLLTSGVRMELPGGAVVCFPPDVPGDVLANAIRAACLAHVTQEVRTC